MAVKEVVQNVCVVTLRNQLTDTLFTENATATNEKCSSKNEKQNFSDLIDDQQWNKKKILCRRCQCVVFGVKKATLLEGTYFIKRNQLLLHSGGKDPKELREMSVGGTEGKQIEKTDMWWFTSNEYAFDTIGFLTIDKLDVLMCGDCEFGPIGWRTSDNKNFWVAAERMNYA
uniref:Uncharacterized protein n=1 Tax=Setaria digitata TaxID=48799 RepID=A0A915Q5W3_9BILA